MALDRSPSRRGGSVVRRQRRLAASPPSSEGSKCRSCCRKFAAFLFSHVGLCALVVGYSVLGAFAFRALEGPYEVRKASQVRALREQTVSRLWDVTAALNVLYKDNWTAAVNEHIREFQLRLVAAVKDGYDGKESGREQQWSFSGAFLYSLTVITTIGYGNIAPKTNWGKIVTILYAIVGIPLMLLYLTNIGDILAKAFKYVYRRLCSCDHRGADSSSRRAQAASYYGSSTRRAAGGAHCRVNHIALEDGLLTGEAINGFAAPDRIGQDAKLDAYVDPFLDDLEERPRVTVPILLCMTIIGGYICGGAVLFSVWEEWNYLDGSYFCFVTLSTIGFGDLVPGDTVVSDSGSQEKLVICSLYLLVGLALIAMCFNLVQEEVVHKLRALGRRLGVVSDSDVDSDSE
ncbi:TWiK family of potassium channels protein 7-like [Dermacentor albipictus]|uniref:TWiK family of potassium channels protein 7-like n=1 Tax=Dermacentor albipictus TaxID=60249 RepID=UPI0031FD5040